jgi:hypothetical protein
MLEADVFATPLLCVMPRAHKSYNAILKDPVEEVFFQDKAGAAVYLQICVEVGSNTELVQCKPCGLYIVLPPGRVLEPFRKHWGSNECKKEKKKRDQEKVLEEEKQKAEVTLRVAFQQPIASSSHSNQSTRTLESWDSWLDAEHFIHSRNNTSMSPTIKGMSEVSASTTYSNSRQPLPTKVRRMYNPSP